MRSPGVEITEIDLTHRIPAVSTVAAGMPVVATRGPVNEAVFITDIKDFVDTFGEPTGDTLVYKSYFTAAGYLRWGNTLWAVRAEGNDARGSTLTLGTTGVDDLAVSYENEITPGDYPLEYEDMDDIQDFDEVLYVVALGPGTYYNDISVATVDADDYGTLENFDLALSQALNRSHRKAIAYQYYTATTDPITADGQVFKVGAFDPGDEEIYAGSISPTGDLSDVDLRDDVITEVDPATEYRPNLPVLGQFLGFEYGPSEDKEFGLYVFDHDNRLLERYLCSTDPDAEDFRRRSIFAPKLVNPVSNYIQVFVKGDEDANVDPLTLGITSLAGGLNDHDEEPTGNVLQALESVFGNPEKLNVDILVDPDMSDFVKRELSAICGERMDAMAILAMPRSYIEAGVENMVDYAKNQLAIDSSYAALYGNYARIYDRFHDTKRWIPVAGLVAGAYAYNDRNAAVWYAPAGLQRGILDGVIELAIDPTKAQRDQLYHNRINPIVDFPGQGVVIFGQKTLQSTASAFDRVNVRRLFVVLETAVRDLARNYLFLNNTMVTRARFVERVSTHLNWIRGQGGIHDYAVVCDQTNNPPEVIDANEFVGDIYIKPTRAIEFIQLNFTAVATGVSFSEIVGVGP